MKEALTFTGYEDEIRNAVSRGIYARHDLESSKYNAAIRDTPFAK